MSSIQHNTKGTNNTAKQQRIASLDIAAPTSVDEVAAAVVARAKERFKNRYLMLHGDDGLETQDAYGNTRRAVQSWHLFSTKTRKNALEPIAAEMLDFVENWESNKTELLEKMLSKLTSGTLYELKLAESMLNQFATHDLVHAQKLANNFNLELNPAAPARSQRMDTLDPATTSHIAARKAGLFASSPSAKKSVEPPAQKAATSLEEAIEHKPSAKAA